MFLLPLGSLLAHTRIPMRRSATLPMTSSMTPPSVSPSNTTYIPGVANTQVCYESTSYNTCFRSTSCCSVAINCNSEHSGDGDYSKDCFTVGIQYSKTLGKNAIFTLQKTPHNVTHELCSIGNHHTHQTCTPDLYQTVEHTIQDYVPRLYLDPCPLP